MKTEKRWFRAYVRQCFAIGSFARKDFELEVTITGSHTAMENEAIKLINAQGFEVVGIESHSMKRDCL